MGLRDDDDNDGWGWGTYADGSPRPHPGSLPPPDIGFCNPRKIKAYLEWEQDRAEYERLNTKG